MEKELISVIVPVHNGQAYLKNCIDSIEAQSYDNLEVLVVNDGSTDQTAAVCDDLKKAYLAQIPAGRFGEPDDIAAACVFLASEEASYINGQTINVNGGMGRF